MLDESANYIEASLWEKKNKKKQGRRFQNLYSTGLKQKYELSIELW